MDNKIALITIVVATLVAFQQASAASVGYDATYKKYLDSWSNAIYIPNRDQPLMDGYLTSWTLYARRAGDITLQVWRHSVSNTFELVAQTACTVKSGAQTIAVSDAIAVKAGDVLGFYFPKDSIIPFDGSECDLKRGYYVHYPTAANVKVGGKFTFSQMQAGWNPCRQYSLKATIESDTETSGYAATNRQYLDSWSNAIYIPNRDTRLPRGILNAWTFYARRAGQIVLQVWRNTGSNSFQLVGQTAYTVKSAGVQTIKASSPIAVRNGDVLGFYFPSNSIIPFDGSECYLKRGYYVHNPNSASVKVGGKFTFSEMSRGWNPCRQYSLTAIISTVVETSGYEAKNRQYLDSWSNAIYIPNRTTRLNSGTLVSWKFYARRTGNIVLQVWRNTGYNTFKLVGQTSVVIKTTGVNDIAVESPISVASGDVLGFYFPHASIIPFDGSECDLKRGYYVHYPSSSKVTVGASFTFQQMLPGWNPCRQYSLQALIA